MQKPDFLIVDHGTIWKFYPETEEQREWLETHVDAEGWQWMGTALCVDHRPARVLLDGLIGCGKKVRLT